MTHGTSVVDISNNEFRKLVAEYPAVAKAMFERKGAKPGQKTVQELDAYRYGEAVRKFSAQGSQEMALEQVQALVEWKLRHGKFRPALMSLVTSNDAKTTKTTISSAIKAYRADPAAPNAPQKALDILTRLRGVGPATASLLLNVHDPERAIFFSDEAFWWLCCGGKKDVIKYNAKEYKTLCEEAANLRRRLGVSMLDVEKAAYVVMKNVEDKKSAGGKNQSKGPKKTLVESKLKLGEDNGAAKRKTEQQEVADGAELRRSKRRKG